MRDFVHASGLYEVQITIQTAFPGTPLYLRLQREGRLLDAAAWDLCTLFDVNFRPDRMSVSELERHFVSLARDLYSDTATKARRRAYINKLRQLKKTEQMYLGGAS